MSGPNELRQVGSFMISLLLACYNNIILLSAGCDGWEGGGQDGNLAGEEEQQQLEIGGSDKGERRDVMRLLALFQKVLGT
jgi:hypothetical protein